MDGLMECGGGRLWRGLQSTWQSTWQRNQGNCKDCMPNKQEFKRAEKQCALCIRVDGLLCSCWVYLSLQFDRFKWYCKHLMSYIEFDSANGREGSTETFSSSNVRWDEPCAEPDSSEKVKGFYCRLASQDSSFVQQAQRHSLHMLYIYMYITG